MVNRWWEFLDYTSIEPRIFIKGKDRFKTKIGAIISLLSSLIILGFAGYFFYIFIENKEIIIITSFDTKPSIPLYDFVKNPVMFRFLKTNLTLDERIGKIVPILNIIKNNQNYKTIYLQTERCSFDKHFKEEWHKTQLKFNITDFFCFKNDNINITDNSMIGDKNLLNLYLTQCYNTTENNNHCYSAEYSTNYLMSVITYLEYYFPINEVDNNNFTEPLTNKFFREKLVVSRRFQYQYIRSLRPIKYISDDGSVFEDKRIYEGFGIDTKKDVLLGLDNLKNSNDVKNFFGVLFIDLKPNYIETYDRRVTKLQTALANVGGIIKFIMTIAQIICQYITSQMMFVDISNSFTNISSNKNKIILNNNDKNVLNNNFTKNSKSEEKQISIIQTLCPKNLFKKDAAIHIMDKCRDLVKFESSVEKIIKYHYEFEKLKKVLFDENELLIFENLKNININDAIIRIKKNEINDISQDVTLLAEMNKKSGLGKKLIELYNS